MLKISIRMMIMVTIVTIMLSPSQEALGMGKFKVIDKVKTKEILAWEEKYKSIKKMGSGTKDHQIIHNKRLREMFQPAFSSVDLYENGKLRIRRYYDWKGSADEDIEYTYRQTPGKDVVVLLRYRWTRTHWDYVSERVPL